ncbi:ATP-binding protein [Bradyrhizobium japonicum]|uniref:ATP-binding protein n=1 Tax=Bradyrhizobium japonicum TaxID=375 RepID=UPI001BAE2CB3|nr:winged helix-turn-helix domain-containing protein [Bradyrhizobium japonicum]MBR0961638.1 winged helix-turn-helix domain-containing protein [Bradyrhizobium japonicum]
MSLEDRPIMLGNTPSESSDREVLFGPFRLNPERRQLLKDGNEVRIGSRGLDLLIALTDRAGEVVGKRDLLALVWPDVVIDEAGLRVHMASLRRALGDGQDGARYIVNVSGRGYSFVAPVTRARAGEPAPRVHVQAPRPERQFPSIPTLLVGRDEAVDKLATLLLKRRFVSVVGAGGIGKTTVAAAVVRRLQSEFNEDCVAFVDLGTVSEPGLVAGAVISSVGCTLGGSDPVAELLGFVADKRILIVLDGCEHLLDASSGLAGELFQRAPDVHLLVTSREPLRVHDETVYSLNPLAYSVDDIPSAADAVATPAVQLFLHRASFSGFDGALSDADAPVVTEICRRTDGIALAIELVASRVGTYGLRGVASLLASNMELSLAGKRNAAPRHRTLQAMLDWSFKLLTEDEQHLLSRLSIFVGSFTGEAACSVAGNEMHDSAEIAATLTRLVDKSLVWVHPVGDTVFYRLPDTTRTYAAAKLEEIGESELVARRHALYFAALFKMLALEHGAYADIGRYASHIGNVRKALEWSFSRADCTTGIELAADAAPLFLGLWLLVECRHWSELALSSIVRFGELAHREARLQEAYAVSSMHTLGNTPEVRKAIRRGLELYEAGEQALPQLRLLAGLNLFLTRLGDFEGALAAATRCKAVTERNGSLSDRVISEWMLAAACHLAGNQAAAVEYCRRGFELEMAIGRLEINLFGYDHHFRAEIALARSLWLLGSPRQACGLALEAMDEAARLPPLGNYYMAVVHAIPVLLWSENTRDSAEHIERAIARAEKHSVRGLGAAAQALKGEWLLMTGKPAAGVEMLRQAQRRLQREQLHMVIPAAARALADGLARSGRYEEARTTIQSAISSAERMRQTFWMPDLLRTKAEIILTTSRPDHAAAELALRQSMDHARTLGACGWQLKAAVLLARLLEDRGQDAEARALIRPIFDAHPEKSGSAALADAQRILNAKDEPGQS